MVIHSMSKHFTQARIVVGQALLFWTDKLIHFHKWPERTPRHRWRLPGRAFAGHSSIWRHFGAIRITLEHLICRIRFGRRAPRWCSISANKLENLFLRRAHLFVSLHRVDSTPRWLDIIVYDRLPQCIVWNIKHIVSADPSMIVEHYSSLRFPGDGHLKLFSALRTGTLFTK